MRSSPRPTSSPASCEYFGDLGEAGRQQVWGATFQTDDKTRNMVGEVPAEFDALIERLNERAARPPAGGADAEHARRCCSASRRRWRRSSARSSISSTAIFEPTRYHANATLRGFYFTSGTQEGTPIDQLIGALARSFGAEEVGAPAYSGTGKSFFLTDLINKVIIGEAGWVSTDRRAVRRALILKAAAYRRRLRPRVAGCRRRPGGSSYSRNRDLIAADRQRGSRTYAAAGRPARRARRSISDRDLRQGRCRCCAGCATCRPATRSRDAADAARRDSSASASASGCNRRRENAYQRRAGAHVPPAPDVPARGAARSQHRNDPGFVYEALKVYLMLGGQAADRSTNSSLAWMRQRLGRQSLSRRRPMPTAARRCEEHLAAMLDLEAGQEPLFKLQRAADRGGADDAGAPERRRARLELLKSQARGLTAPDWVAARRGGPDFALVFEASSGDGPRQHPRPRLLHL